MFGNFAKTVIKTSDEAARKYGLSANVYRENANLIGSLFKNQGVAVGELAGKTEQMIGVGADLAATFGGTTTDAVGALGAAFKGEYDQLERYGVSLKESTVSAELAARGQDKLTGAALAAAKQQAVTDLIMKQSKDSLGAFGRESGTLANQQQVLAAQFDNIKAKIGTALLPILTKLATWVNNVVLPAVSTFAGYLTSTFGPAIAGIKNFFGPVIASVQGFFAGFGQGQGQMSGLVAWFNGTLVPAVRGIGTAFMGLLNVVRPIVAQIVTAVIGQWQKMQPSIMAIFNSVKNIITSAMSIIKSVITIVTNVIQAVWQRFGGTILRFITTSLNNVVNVVKGVFKVIEGIFKVVSSALKGDWQGMWNGIKQIVSGAVGVIKGIISQAWNIIRTVTSTAWNALKGIISAAWDRMKGAVSNGISSVINLVKGLPDKIKGALSGAGSMLTQVGKDIIQGLINGLESARDWLMDKVQSIADSIPGWAKKALGMSSPSKVMAEIGEMTMAGLVIGMQARAKQVIATATGIMGDLAAAFSRNFEAVQIGPAQTFVQEQFGPLEEQLTKLIGRVYKARKQGANESDKHYNAYLKNLEKAEQAHVTKAIRGLTKYKNAVRVAAAEYDRLQTKYADAEQAGKDALDAINGRLETQRGVVQQLRDEMTSYAKGVRDAFVSFGNVVGLGDRENAGRYGFGGRLEFMLQDLRTRAQQARDFSAVIKQLIKDGINEETLRQLVAAGPEAGLATATAIAEGGVAAIDEINSLMASIATEGAALGEVTSQTFYAQGVAQAQALADGIAAEAEASRIATANTLAGIAAEIAAAQTTLTTAMANLGAAAGDGIINGITSKDGAIRKAMREIAKQMKETLKKAWGIKSPSRVFRDIGRDTTRGLVIGLQDVSVKRAGQVLAADLQRGFADPRLSASAAFSSATANGSGSNSFSIRLTAQQISQLQRGREIQADLDAYARAGGRVMAS